VLAYVFSHRPGPGVDSDSYEEALRRFHGALANDRPAGFVSSASYATEAGYADWYLIESSAALDAINDAAVSGRRAGPHDAAARMAVDGVGKLLKLAEGEANLDAAFEIGFAKPKGMGYADLYASLRPFASRPGAGLWRRMMVLGPPPEFCLVTPERVELPPDMQPEVVARNRV
jgi:hypothetical protein